MTQPRTASADELDRRIIAALQLNSRAPWSAIARWAGASESTVQRRFNDLHARGLLHVVGVIDLNRTDAGTSMLVRVQALPGKGRELAETLAARPEARFLAIVTGNADLVVDFVARDNDERLRVLFTDLPGADLIAGTENVAVIRTFTTAPLWDSGLLPPEAARDLRPTTTLPYDRDDWDAPPDTLPDLERAIVDELARDGRLPIAALGRSESTVARALDRLIARGNLRFRTLAEPQLIAVLRPHHQDTSFPGPEDPVSECPHDGGTPVRPEPRCLATTSKSRNRTASQPAGATPPADPWLSYRHNANATRTRFGHPSTGRSCART